MITIATYRNLMSAEVAKTRLESCGIKTAIADAHFYTLGYGSIMDGVRLQVPAADAGRAREVLAAGSCTGLPDGGTPPAESPEPGAAIAGTGAAPARAGRRPGLLLFLFGVFCLVLGRPAGDGRPAHAFSGQLFLAGSISILAGLWISYGGMNEEPTNGGCQ